MKKLLALALALLAGEAVAQRKETFRVELGWSQQIAWPAGMTKEEANDVSQLEYVKGTHETVIWTFDCKNKKAYHVVKGYEDTLTFQIYGVVLDPRNNLYVFECGSGKYPDWKTIIQEKRNGELHFLAEEYGLYENKRWAVFSDAVTVARVSRVTP